MDRFRARVTAAEAEHGWEPSAWFPTSAEDDGRSAARSAREAQPNVVLVAGGDGTTRIVASELQGHGIPLALVPIGTGNLLARNLGLPLGDLDAAVQIAFSGTDRDIDVALAEFEREDGSVDRNTFLVMAGIGLDANMALNTNSRLKKRIGWLAYVIPIARSVLGHKQAEMHYRIDKGPRLALKAHTVIVGNCGTLTNDILLIPDAVVDDGVLDVVVLRPKRRAGWGGVGSRLAMNGILNRSAAGRDLMRLTPDLKALRYAQGRRLDVAFSEPEPIELDGDSFGKVTKARITVQPKALIVRGASAGGRAHSHKSAVARRRTRKSAHTA